MPDSELLKRIREIIAAVPRSNEQKLPKSKKLSTEQILGAAAPAIIHYCLRGQPFTADHIHLGTAELRARYKTSVKVGEAMGYWGEGKPFHTDYGGDGWYFHPCRENALLAIEGQSLPKLAKILDYASGEALQQAISSLPGLETMPFEASDRTPLPYDKPVIGS